MTGTQPPPPPSPPPCPVPPLPQGTLLIFGSARSLSHEDHAKAVKDCEEVRRGPPGEGGREERNGLLHEWGSIITRRTVLRNKVVGLIGGGGKEVPTPGADLVTSLAYPLEEAPPTARIWSRIPSGRGYPAPSPATTSSRTSPWDTTSPIASVEAEEVKNQPDVPPAGILSGVAGGGTSFLTCCYILDSGLYKLRQKIRKSNPEKVPILFPNESSVGIFFEPADPSTRPL